MSSEVISIGPVGDNWLYTTASKSYDLSRSSHPKLHMRTTRGKEVDSISLDPGISALIIVDMQNFFLHPRCRHHALGLATVEPTRRIIEKCREVGIQIVWLNWGLTDRDLATLPAGTRRSTTRALMPGAVATSSYGDELGDGRGRCLMAGSWNAEIYEALKENVGGDDVHCAKNRLSGMWSEEQPLRKYLMETGKRTLIFAGVNSDRCVLGTLADVAYAGWDCVVLEDCCATTSVEAHEVCVENIELLHGFVVDHATFCDAKLL